MGDISKDPSWISNGVLFLSHSDSSVGKCPHLTLWKAESFQRTIFFKDFIYLFLESREGREGEKHQCVAASWAPPTGDLACNSGTCPDRESNQWPLGSQAGAQSTEPHQSGLKGLLNSRDTNSFCLWFWGVWIFEYRAADSYFSTF